MSAPPPLGPAFSCPHGWARVKSDFLAWLFAKPIVGPIVRSVLKPLTYYKIDTAFYSRSSGAARKRSMSSSKRRAS